MKFCGLMLWPPKDKRLDFVPVLTKTFIDLWGPNMNPCKQ